MTKTKRVRHLAHRIQAQTLSGVTRMIEFLMILTSLLWAVEANAGKKTPRMKRAPSSIEQTSTDASKADAELSTLRLKDLLTEKKFHPAPTKVTSGANLSNSFRENPYYAPPTVEVLRFPSK